MLRCTVGPSRPQHAFVALAGGVAKTAKLNPGKIADVCVLAGMDPAAPEVPVLMRELHFTALPHGHLTTDQFLNVLVNFRCIYT